MRRHASHKKACTGGTGQSPKGPQGTAEAYLPGPCSKLPCWLSWNKTTAEDVRIA